jgi:hypothetical protein
MLISLTALGVSVALDAFDAFAASPLAAVAARQFAMAAYYGS